MPNPTPLNATSSSLRAVIGGVVLAVASTFTLSVQAQPGHHQGMHAGGPGLGMPMMGRHLDRLLDGVNATETQRAQIKQIAAAAAADLKAHREGGRALREQAIAVFTQPTVDANAAEALRQQMLARHDQASRRKLQAMLDISRVLTPEQRQQLAQQMTQRLEQMERHRRERQQTDGGQRRG